ncbi:MAG: DEAD/DEAH box helicase [Methylacidiphilales bacterium]|nr:DEAD/DEAH box helicase [Candidatus Methylacidiphilales bacterium]NJR15049.1 DEAD/DEAH box helicase [Calothrix sp. CSU_2_0]
MTESAKNTNEFQEIKYEKEDNRLPYEPPKLRKHGKVNDTTATINFAPDFDGFLGFTDRS